MKYVPSLLLWREKNVAIGGQTERVKMHLKPRSDEKIPVISAKVLPLGLVCSEMYPFIFFISLLCRKINKYMNK